MRWRDLRKVLEEDGADQASLDGIEARIGEDSGTPGRHGLVAVAASGDLVFAAELSDPPAQSSGRVSALPHLLPYLAQRATDVPHVVVGDRPYRSRSPGQ